MKRTMFFFLMAFCVAAMAFSQRHDNRWQQGQHRGAPPCCYSWGNNQSPVQPRGFSRSITPPRAEITSVSGNLTIAQGMIAVNSDGVTYVAAGLNRFVGFIDGLREGAAVTLEGNAFAVPNDDSKRLLHVQKMTLDGRDYDLARPRPEARRR